MRYEKLEKFFSMKSLENNLNMSEILKEKVEDVQNIINSPDDDKRIDEIKTKALEVYSELIDSGFSCDPKHASNFLEVAARMLEIALNAEKIKIDKKLELKKIKLSHEKLKLMKRRMELEERNSGNYLEVDENGIYVDRNELLKKLLEK